MNDAAEYINDMTSRYVYAATRFMPAKQREEARLELQSLISDMLDERTAGRQPAQKDIDVVLTELGRPSDFFKKEDENVCLIGPELYPIYRQVVKLVLAAEAGGITIAMVVLAILGQLSGVRLLFSYLSTLFSGAFIGWGGITLFFALAQWRGGKLKSNLTHQPWSLANLPTVPENKEKISKAESVTDIIFTILALILFIFFSRYVAAYVSVSNGAERMVIPLFQETELVKAMPFIVVSMLLGLGRECFCLMEGRYTRRLFMVTAITDLLSLICWAIALWGYSIFNPVFSAQITAIFPDLIEVSWVFESLPQVFMAILIFAHLLDSIVTAFRAWKYQKT